jgi:hypothetical protein
VRANSTQRRYESYKYRRNLKEAKRNGAGDGDAKMRANAMRKRLRTAAKRRATSSKGPTDESATENGSARSERLPSPQAQIKKERERSQELSKAPSAAAAPRRPTTAEKASAKRNWWRASGRESTELAITPRRIASMIRADDDEPANPMPIHQPGGLEEVRERARARRRA